MISSCPAREDCVLGVRSVLRAHSPTRAAQRSRGFTLIEILIALTITLIMMGAVVALFGVISDSVSNSRALIELQERLRGCRNRLQTDLAGATATMEAPLKPSSDLGYFEIIEDPYMDRDWVMATSATGTGGTNDGSGGSQQPLGLMGDVGDVIMFTARSNGEPFVGRMTIQTVDQVNSTPDNVQMTLMPTTVESQVAEIMYFAIPNGLVLDGSTNPSMKRYTLYRRVLLVKPSLITNPRYINGFNPAYFDNNDVSAHYEPQLTPDGTAQALPKIVPNSLADLTKPENRFAHNPTPGMATGYPFNLNNPCMYPMGKSAYMVPLGYGGGIGGPRWGDDIILTDVVGFDVQVYDPGAPVKVINDVAVTPSDPLYEAASYPSPPVFGAYVDLGYNYDHSRRPGGAPLPSFNMQSVRFVPGTPMVAPNLPREITNDINPMPIPTNPPQGVKYYTWDTWSTHYENDGLRQNASRFDQAFDGVDNDRNGLVDDSAEYETLSMFAAPIRGIKITIRAYEPGSQQVREISVIQDFMPE